MGRPAIHQNWGHQQRWWHLCHNIFKKRWKTVCSNCERGVRICQRNNYTDNKASEEGGGCTPGDEGCSPTPHERPQWRCSPYRPWRTPHWSRWTCPAGSCFLWRSCIGARDCTGVGSWQDQWPVEKTPHRSRFSGRNCHLWGTHAVAIHSWRTAPCKNCWNS